LTQIIKYLQGKIPEGLELRSSCRYPEEPCCGMSYSWPLEEWNSASLRQKKGRFELIKPAFQFLPRLSLFISPDSGQNRKTFSWPNLALGYAE
jgi:hypothetical protein